MLLFRVDKIAYNQTINDQVLSKKLGLGFIDVSKTLSNGAAWNSNRQDRVVISWP